MKNMIRKFILATLMAIMATAAWQGGHVVFAEEAAGDGAAAPAAAPAEGEPADDAGSSTGKKSASDYYGTLYDQLPDIQQNGITRRDFIKLNQALQTAVFDDMEATGKKRGGDVQARLDAERQKLQDQLKKRDWTENTNKLEESNLLETLEDMPQYSEDLQDEPVLAKVRDQYNAIPERTRKKMSFEEYKRMQTSLVKALELESDATWSDVNAAQKKLLRDLLADVKREDGIALSEMKKKFAAGIGSQQMRFVHLLEPSAVATTVTDTGVVTRVLDISPLVTITLRGGHSFDGYLLLKETMGKNPARYIGVRPLTFGNTGVFSGVMVMPRTDIRELTFFDEEARECKSFSFAAYIKQYMIVEEEVVVGV